MATDLPNLDQELTQLDSQTLELLAERGRNDLYFFGKAIWGNQDMVPHCHGPLCTFLGNHPARFKLCLIPRGHLKTSCGTVAGTAQRVAQNVNGRYLIANETSTNAERFCSAIKQGAEANKVFRAIYSDIIPKSFRGGGWSTKELTFRREWRGPEPTIDTVGMTGAWTSRHFTHITFDDPISEEAAKSEAVMKDVINRIAKVFSLMVDPSQDTFTIIGTRWAFYDVYSYMEGWLKNRLGRYIIAAIDEGQPIWPERFTIEELANIRDAPDMGEYLFSCQYMNNPRDPSRQDFNVNDIRFWRYAGPDEDQVVLYNRDGQVHRIWELSQLDVVATVDLAAAETVTSDRNAVVVTGTSPAGEVIVLHAWAKRCNPLELINHLFWMNRVFRPRVVGIEDVAYQKAFKYFVQEQMSLRDERFYVVPVKHQNKKDAKIRDIRGLQPVAATGNLYILPTMHDLRTELAEFPLGKHDDLADALSLQMPLWHGAANYNTWVKYKAVEKRMIERAHRDAAGLWRGNEEQERERLPFDQAEGFVEESPIYSFLFD